MSRPKSSPASPASRKYIADLFGLTLIVDAGRLRYPPQYIVQDTVPADHIKLLPKQGWWKVCR